MKQIVQNLKSGETLLEEIPAPKVSSGSILIKTSRSLVSLGTEKMLVEFGKAGLISKARQQPDKVKQVLDKIKSDGLIPTLETVFSKLGTPLPLGYCNVGTIIEIGDGVTEFKIGDRVASNGNHAEIVSVPKNLAARIPDNVTDEEAAFTIIGSIALQGIRLVKPTFDETVVVVGLGLIGLITCQLLKATGANVIGFDIDENKIKLANSFGINALNASDSNSQIKTVEDCTGGIGADAVIITASSKSNDIISTSAKMCRKRGRIVLVGVVGLDINRTDFYEKELTFQVSCSYGPGRYDDNYESKGLDYPLPYVRWTEKRNFEAILNAIAEKRIDVNPLITEILELKDYGKIYNNISKSNSIASIISYPEKIDQSNIIKIANKSFSGTKGIMGIIGAGNFTSVTIMPILKKIGAEIKYISSAKGLSSTILAKKFSVGNSTTELNNILEDKDVDSILITTRHNSHSSLVVKALENNKNVFVEKPLVIKEAELKTVIDAYNKSDKNIMVGFNRRFSPFSLKVKELFASQSPMNIIATMNAGYIPPEVWVHDMEIGGGRIIGEACHYIDLITFFTGSKVTKVVSNALGKNPEDNTDNVIITLKYENGSQGVINYFSNGHKSYSKERVEIYSQGKIVVIDNFRTMFGYGFKNFKKYKSKQDKGHLNQFKMYKEFLEKGGEPLISFDEIVNTTKASIAAIQSIKTSNWIEIN